MLHIIIIINTSENEFHFSYTKILLTFSISDVFAKLVDPRLPEGFFINTQYVGDEIQMRNG